MCLGACFRLAEDLARTDILGPSRSILSEVVGWDLRCKPHDEAPSRNIMAQTLMYTQLVQGLGPPMCVGVGSKPARAICGIGGRYWWDRWTGEAFQAHIHLTAAGTLAALCPEEPTPMPAPPSPTGIRERPHKPVAMTSSAAKGTLWTRCLGPVRDLRR